MYPLEREDELLELRDEEVEDVGLYRLELDELDELLGRFDELELELEELLGRRDDELELDELLGRRLDELELDELDELGRVDVLELRSLDGVLLLRRFSVVGSRQCLSSSRRCSVVRVP